MVTPASTNDSCHNPIFVVGVWRSGTSLLVSLLNQHPEIALMYECSVWDFPRPFEKFRFEGEWLRRQEFFNRALSRHRLIFGDNLRGLEQVKTPEDLYKVYAHGKGAPRWGEKAPTYARRLRLLAERYPNSSLLLIWRDPEAVFRSVLRAGQSDSFFRRHGMLARVLGNHEMMLRDVAALERSGHRLLQVDYDCLVDDTASTLRRICDFLKVEFQPEMATLQGADHVGLFNSPIHAHLRDGVIVRQNASTDLAPCLSAKLGRFRNRTLRLRGLMKATAEEPSGWELLRLRLAHNGWSLFDGSVRALFEFLPLPWLQSYRWVKAALAPSALATRRLTPRELAGHTLTILTSYAVLATVAALKYSHPHLVFLPLSLLPSAMLTLTINRNWGLFCAGGAAFLGPLMEWFANENCANTMTLIWNFLMRFAVFALFVVLLDRARSEASRNSIS